MDDNDNPKYPYTNFVTSNVTYSTNTASVDPEKLREAMKAVGEAMQKKLDAEMGYKERTPPPPVSPERMIYLLEGMVTSPYKYVVHIDDLVMWWRELRKLGFILRRVRGKSIIKFRHKDSGIINEMMVDIHRFMQRGSAIRIDMDEINKNMRTIDRNWRVWW